MHLSEIVLYNFRNLADQTVQFGPKVNLILGRNAQGKTNLVEAFSLLSHTKSFRTSKSEELIRWGAEECSVFGNVVRQGDEDQRGVRLGVALDAKKKSVFLDEKKVSSIAEFVGQLKIVSFSPTDLMLVKGTPQVRRSFLDKHMLYKEPRVIEDLLQYQRAFKSKNTIIKDLVSKATPKQTILNSIAPWNILLANSAAAIISTRKTFLQLLEKQAQQVYLRFGKEHLELKYNSATDNALQGEITAEGVLGYLESQSDREIFREGNVTGPHKDDVVITLDGMEAKSFASQGQTRSIVLALKLALRELINNQTGDAPVVLLDDVDSELDSHRRAALFEIIFDHASQVLLTGTDANSWLPKVENSVRFSVENGVIKRDCLIR